jgi:hypothetical protein
MHAYHETFDADGSVPARPFVPFVDKLRELWDVVPYKSVTRQMQRPFIRRSRYMQLYLRKQSRGLFGTYDEGLCLPA